MNEELSLETIIDDILALADELAEARKAEAEIDDVPPDHPSGFIGTMDDYRAWKAEARKALDEIADVSPDNPSGFIVTMDDYLAWKVEADRKAAMLKRMAQAVNAIEKRLHEMIWKAFNVLPKGAIIAVGGRFAWKHYNGLYIDLVNSAVCISSHSTINRLIVEVRELPELTAYHLPEGVTMTQYAKAVAELL